jgi:hypothetical protein
MKKAVLVLLIVLLGGLVLPLLPQPAIANGGVVLITDAATNVDYFWGELNGHVSQITGCTVTEVGFVWSPVSHPSPGTTEPWNTDYASDAYGGYTYSTESHSSPFSWTYGGLGAGVGAFLRPNTVYYYRACVYEGAPYSQWNYADEVVIDVPLNDEGTWAFYGWGYESYVTVTARSPLTLGSNTACLSGSVIWSDPDHTQWMFGDGFVYDTTPHANPSGWPDSYMDVNPAACEYPNYVSPYHSEFEGLSTWTFSFSYLLTDLAPGTYYYRVVGDVQGGGDWVYGPQESFTIAEAEDCQLIDNQLHYTEDYYGPDDICQDTWVRQDIGPAYTRTATELWIDIYRVGSPLELGVHIYPVDPDTWEPIWASEMWEGYVDVSGITEDIAGEWVELEFGETLTFDELGWYAIISDMDEDCLGSDFVVWVSQPYDYSTYDGTMAVTNDTGASWNWVNRDCLFALACCSGGISVAGTYETWGYVPSTRPVWYQAWPSILKILYIGAVLLAAMFTYRQKPKPEYPDMGDIGDAGGMSG